MWGRSPLGPQQDDEVYLGVRLLLPAAFCRLLPRPACRLGCKTLTLRPHRFVSLLWIAQHQDDAVSPEEHLGDEPVAIDGAGALLAAARLGDLRGGGGRGGGDVGAERLGGGNQLGLTGREPFLPQLGLGTLGGVREGGRGGEQVGGVGAEGLKEGGGSKTRRWVGARGKGRRQGVV